MYSVGVYGRVKIQDLHHAMFFLYASCVDSVVDIKTVR